MSADVRLSQSVFISVHQWFKGLEQNRRKRAQSGSILAYPDQTKAWITEDTERRLKGHGAIYDAWLCELGIRALCAL